MAFFQEKLSLRYSIDRETSILTRGIQLSMALHMLTESEAEAERTMRRIIDVTDKKVNELLVMLYDVDEETLKAVSSKAATLKEYFRSEHQDMEKERQLAFKTREHTLEDLLSSQTKSIHELLSKVTSEKLDMLNEVVTSLFDRMDSTQEVHMDEAKIPELEYLADALFSESISVDEASKKFQNLVPFIEGGLSQSLRHELDTIVSNKAVDEFANFLDTLRVSADMTPVYEELHEAKKVYTVLQAQGRDLASKGKVEEANTIYTKATTDAFLVVQKLIREDKIKDSMIDLALLENVMTDD